MLVDMIMPEVLPTLRAKCLLEFGGHKEPIITVSADSVHHGVSSLRIAQQSDLAIRTGVHILKDKLLKLGGSRCIGGKVIFECCWIDDGGN